LDSYRANSDIRSIRKREHINYFLSTGSERSTLFENIYLEHNALPEVNFDEINTEKLFLGKKISFPLVINAITGGFEGAFDINRDLATLAEKFNVAIAVGSQTIALNDKEYEDSFKIVREIVGDGIVVSNLSASVNKEDAVKAIDMIKADGIQLHLNPAQEICMPEGERDFKGILNNIHNIVSNTSKPVIVKEVGFGISRNTAVRLLRSGVRYIDIGGSGGTNFIKIESARNRGMDFTELFDWGIPTALSLIQCRSVSSRLNIICSGGVKQADEVVKALCAGADMVGISGALLRELVTKGYDAAEKYLEQLIYKSKVIMLLLGKKTLEDLRTVPYKVKGELRELL
jgi:isopentenyl-diphosphate Delta-isomerase